MNALVAALVACVPAVAIVACAGGELARPTSAEDPANPAAPETPWMRDERRATASSVRGTAGADASVPALDGGEVYACPMHPDVRSDAPGRCPRCGMALVPSTPHGPPRP